MAWPAPNDYADAVQRPRVFLEDEELRGGQVERTPLGLPMVWSGNFADVYKIHCPATSNTWALKCFTRRVPGQQERYRQIAAHLDQAKLPFTVDFQYIEQGIRVGGERFPVLKMRWVEGLMLNQFVEEHIERPGNLKMVLDLWVKLAARLRQAEIAHADLQHGNVILVPTGGGSLALRLIDYDGMYVPALAGSRSGEVGLPAYQHPQRIREGTYDGEVDRFSHLVIYTAIRCLMVGRSALWNRFNTGENLLFRETDLCRPEASQLFDVLWRIGDADARSLVGRLILACRRPLGESPLLQELVATDGQVLPLSGNERTEVEAVLGVEAVPAATPYSTGPIEAATPMPPMAAEQQPPEQPPQIAAPPHGETEPVVPGAFEEFLDAVHQLPAPSVARPRKKPGSQEYLGPIRRLWKRLGAVSRPVGQTVLLSIPNRGPYGAGDARGPRVPRR
jgi:hypothetical protein